jgi:hypothetical protein
MANVVDSMIIGSRFCISISQLIHTSDSDRMSISAGGRNNKTVPRGRTQRDAYHKVIFISYNSL